MTTDDKLAALAKAILELSQKCAEVWDDDGEQHVTRGVLLDLERDLQKIAAGE